MKVANAAGFRFFLGPPWGDVKKLTKQDILANREYNKKHRLYYKKSLNTVSFHQSWEMENGFKVIFRIAIVGGYSIPLCHQNNNCKVRYPTRPNKTSLDRVPEEEIDHPKLLAVYDWVY